jgi:hypothetical protein
MRANRRSDVNMLKKIHEILLTKYIGSILVALLAWQALVVLIETVLRTSFWFINNQRDHSILGSSRAPLPWDNLVFSAVTVLLYLLLAYFLVRWLYPVDPSPSSLADDEAEPSLDQP